MDAIRIITRIDGDTVRIPELTRMRGKEVEIIVIESEPEERPHDRSLRGSVLRDDDPYGPAWSCMHGRFRARDGRC